MLKKLFYFLLNHNAGKSTDSDEITERRNAIHRSIAHIRSTSDYQAVLNDIEKFCTDYKSEPDLYLMQSDFTGHIHDVLSIVQSKVQ